MQRSICNPSVEDVGLIWETYQKFVVLGHFEDGLLLEARENDVDFYSTATRAARNGTLIYVQHVEPVRYSASGSSHHGPQAVHTTDSVLSLRFSVVRLQGLRERRGF